jgi:hypothetical protein
MTTLIRYLSIVVSPVVVIAYQTTSYPVIYLGNME